MAADKETREVEILLNAQQANASIKEMAAGVALMNNQLAKMSQDDPRREQLKKDFQELKTRVAEARAEINGYVKSEEELRAENEALQATNAETLQQAQQLTASYRQMKEAAGLLEKQLEELSADDPGRQQLIDDYQHLKTRMAEARQEFGGAAAAAEALRQQELALAAATQQLLVDGQRAGASFNEMRAAAGLLEKQLHGLSADDPGRAALIRDYQVLQQRIGAAKTEMTTYVKTEEELREEAARLAEETANLNQQQATVLLNGQKLNASFRELTESAALLEKELHDLSADDPGRKKLIADYQALQARIEGVKKELGSAQQESGFFKQALGNAFAFATGGGIEALAEKIVDVGKDIFETTAKFEKYEAVMTNALGDKSKAQQAMKDIQQLAATTPFAVDELTGSFIKFVNRGLNPSMEEMKKLADLAASQGKSFDQLTEAVLDAGGGEFERLKEFGLKASKSGDQVSLSFKGVNQTVKNTPAAIQGAILAFGGMQGVAGSTAAISKTLEGQWSNLGDTADMLETKIGGGLKPMFTLLLTLVANFIGWLGRFADAAAPLKSLFTDIIDVAGDLYAEIGDVLKGLGLFSEQTDTVKIAVEALKFVLTLVLLPIKTLFQVSKGLVDLFIDWYNKSELLRGVLGGLGAVVVSLFMTIKNDALKILGGVADILVGIFTLDKNKIIAGFKSALAATADVALEAGDRAANQFAKGYLANKDNHITRTGKAKTSAEDEAAPAGDQLTSDKSAGDAAAEKKREAAAKKAKAARDKADREQLSDLKRWVKDEGDILDLRDEWAIARQEAANTDELKRRELQRQKIRADADKKYNDLLVLEGDHTAELAAVIEERDLKLRELQKGFDEKDEKERQEKLDKALANSAADAEVALAALEESHALGLVSEQEYQDQLYDITRKGLQERLALLMAAGQGETAEAKKIQAALSKAAGDYAVKSKKAKQEELTFEQKVELSKVSLLKEGLQLVEDNLDKKSAAYEIFKAARKTAELAEIGINLQAELAANAKAAAENPLNGVSAGSAGAIQLAITNGLSIVRATAAGIKLAGFAKGGATGDGLDARGPSFAGFREAMSLGMGLNVGTSGKLVDDAGLEVAGIVHKNEYVIPEWMREDPQVLQVENWLEARRQRGFYQGGPTTEGDTRASGTVAGTAEASTDRQQLIQVLASLDQRLQGVEQWATELTVANDLLDLNRQLDKVKQVQNRSAVRSANE